MEIPTTREVMDLERMIEGLRAQVVMSEEALREAIWQVRSARALVARQDDKIQLLHKEIDRLRGAP